LSALALKQGIRAYDERSEIRCAVIAAMNENKAVWKEFAPCDGVCFTYNPESESAEVWIQRMRGVILPNHFRILAIMKANLHFMKKAELEVFAQYQEH
ncbi:TPA: hypothetical protein OQP86_004378, partial [Shigella flexneri]|nr:hypothetical protein [Shigella flexneri]